MINKRVEEVINKQINAEFYSAFLYLSMSAYCESKNLKGFANWTKVQYKEETTHALKFYNYLVERGGKVILGEIKGPKTDWNNLIEIFTEIYEHEQKVTAMISNIVNIAIEERDHATVNELQWFVTEQVEEEANASEILEQLKYINNDGAALFMMDRELKQRVFVDQTVPQGQAN